MSVRLSLFALAALALLGGCIDPIETPPCAATAFTQTGVSGDTVTLSTGLRYIEAPQGDGVAAAWCKTALIDYDAYQVDGTKFDSSRDRGTPIIFVPGVGDLIDGVEQGVIGLRPGHIRRLIIPPSLGYGATERRDAAGNLVLPANSTIIFDVEVLDFER
jgi:FKBP-type peptidyl-prolyl cis-trans isomerase